MSTQRPRRGRWRLRSRFFSFALSFECVGRLAGADALDDSPFRSFDPLDLEALVVQVVEGLAREVVGGEADGQWLEQAHGQVLELAVGTARPV